MYSRFCSGLPLVFMTRASGMLPTIDASFCASLWRPTNPRDGGQAEIQRTEAFGVQMFANYRHCSLNENDCTTEENGEDIVRRWLACEVAGAFSPELAQHSKTPEASFVGQLAHFSSNSSHSFLGSPPLSQSVQPILCDGRRIGHYRRDCSGLISASMTASRSSSIFLVSGVRRNDFVSADDIVL
jgi:hypothetical protein